MFSENIFWKMTSVITRHTLNVSLALYYLLLTWFVLLWSMREDTVAVCPDSREIESHVYVSACTEDIWFIWIRHSVADLQSCMVLVEIILFSFLAYCFLVLFFTYLLLSNVFSSWCRVVNSSHFSWWLIHEVKRM